jgi:hypothetical protein
MTVRLTVKLAEVVDGIDLTHCVEGDAIELSTRDAQLLVAEGWAEPVARPTTPTRHAAGSRDRRAMAAERGYKNNAA